MKKRLNFGCGSNILVGWDNVDIQTSQKIMKSFDFEKFPYPLKKNYYDYVLLKNILEHIENPEKVLEEIHKACKPNATIEILVPHYSNKGAYNDFEHKHFFNEICFIQLEKKHTRIKEKNLFKIKKLKLIPTKIGKFFPKKIRNKLSLFLNGLIKQIHVKLVVLK